MRIGKSGEGRLTVHALSSGSSGNSFLVQFGDDTLLIDAGIPVRRLAAQVAQRNGGRPLSAVLITHEHSDHSCGAGQISRRMQAPLIANAATLAACAARDELGFESRELATGAECAVGRMRIRSFPISHDAVEPVGYVVSAGGSTLAFCTDLGEPTVAVKSAISKAHLVVLEANHDREWLQRGPYAPSMKARVASSTGHLSNDECGDLVAERADEHGPCIVWLAHLSRVNNSVPLARRMVAASIARQTRTPVLLDVALRDHPSVTWSAGCAGVQLALL